MCGIRDLLHDVVPEGLRKPMKNLKNDSNQIGI